MGTSVWVAQLWTSAQDPLFMGYNTGCHQSHILLCRWYHFQCRNSHLVTDWEFGGISSHGILPGLVPVQRCPQRRVWGRNSVNISVFCVPVGGEFRFPFWPVWRWSGVGPLGVGVPSHKYRSSDFRDWAVLLSSGPFLRAPSFLESGRVPTVLPMLGPCYSCSFSTETVWGLTLEWGRGLSLGPA